MLAYLDTLGTFGPVIALGAAGIVLMLFAGILIAKQPSDPYEKLKAQAAGQTSAKPAGLRHGGSGDDKLQKYAKFLEPQDGEEFSAARQRMIQAGYRSKNAVRTFHFAQFALGLGALFVGLILVLVKSSTSDPTTQQVMMMTVLPGGVGYMLPKYWVTKRIQKRQEAIENGFPDSLDMMLVCVEAGQSLDQAIMKVSQELRAGCPELADEFGIVSHEMKAGKDKQLVLRDMAERSGVQDVSSFVTVLIQSQTFGTSIADALRVYAGEMRDKRVMRAEEKANKLPTKMTLATMMLTVPPLLIILIGPSIYEIYDTLSNGGGPGL
ncbi:MAG: type II secretion system F family protein [Shimia sp.]